MEYVNTLFSEMAPYFSEGIIQCDRNRTIIYVNEKICNSLNYEADDLIGKKCLNSLFAEGFQLDDTPTLDKRKLGVTGQFEAPFLKKDQTTLWCSVTTIPEFDKDGNLLGSINIIKDHSHVHDEEVRLDRLRKLHEGFYKLNQIHTRGYNFKQISLTILQILVTTFDINVARIYKVKWSDDQAILDLEADKMKFKTINKLSEFLPDGISKLIPSVGPGSIYEQVIESAEPQFFGSHHRISEKFLLDTADPVNLIYKTILDRMVIESYFLFPIVHFNETVYLIECISEHKLERGQVDDLHTLLDNVSNLIDRKLSEIDLQRSEKRWRELIENSSEITCILDDNGIVKFISQPVFRLMGYNVQEVMGKNILEFVHDEDRDVAKSALFRRIKEGGKGGFTIYRFRSKNGEYKYLRVVTSVHLTNPEINGIILNAHDVTDLIRSENEKYLVMINTQETERQRLSRDLHDGVGQYLAATIMYMEILDPVVQSNLTDQDVELFHLAKQLLQKATKETRIVSHNIMPPSLKDFGFVDCLKGLIADLSHDNLIINLNIVPQYYEVDFLDTVSLTLFRSIQQLLNNSIEHGCATKIDLTITEKANETEVEVRDNGKGFDIEQLRGHDGIGLLSIQQRMNSVGGSVSIQSEIGKGTVIKISLKRR